MRRTALTRAELQELLAFPAAHAQAGYHTPPEGVRFLFEAGLPDPELFPIDDLARLSEKVLREEFAEALQYGGAHDDGIAAGESACAMCWLHVRGHRPVATSIVVA